MMISELIYKLSNINCLNKLPINFFFNSFKNDNLIFEPFACDLLNFRKLNINRLSFNDLITFRYDNFI